MWSQGPKGIILRGFHRKWKREKKISKKLIKKRIFTKSVTCLSIVFSQLSFHWKFIMLSILTLLIPSKQKNGNLPIIYFSASNSSTKIIFLLNFFCFSELIFSIKITSFEQKKLYKTKNNYEIWETAWYCFVTFCKKNVSWHFWKI